MANKAKTVQAFVKRFKVTKNKKIVKRYCGQDHFNARNPGKITRKKRRDTLFSTTHAKAVMVLTGTL